MLITVVAFLFVLAFSITIHEFGHFIAAKICGIPVEKFSIGFGPPLLRMKIGETDFRIAYFPLGGYVKMAGDDEGEFPVSKKGAKESGVGASTDGAAEAAKDIKYPDAPKTAEAMLKQDALPISGSKQAGLYDAPIYKRILVVSSGPLFNIISAMALLFIITIIFGNAVIPYLKVIVEKGSVAEWNGFIDNDSLISINGHFLDSWDDFADELQAQKGRELVITYMRNGAMIEQKLPAGTNTDSLGLMPSIPPILGYVQIDGPAYKAGLRQGDRVVSIDDKEVAGWYDLRQRVMDSGGKTLFFEWQHGGQKMNALVTPIAVYDTTLKDTIGQINIMFADKRIAVPLFKALVLAAGGSVRITWITLETLYRLIIGRIPRKALGGPIAIFKLSGQAARWGMEWLLNLIVIISINLGLVNLFPLPAFDGGHIIIGIVEALRKKRFSQKTRLVIQQIGYAIILLIIVYVTFNDITR
jgi:regulator of sigma E protease